MAKQDRSTNASLDPAPPRPLATEHPPEAEDFTQEKELTQEEMNEAYQAEQDYEEAHYSPDAVRMGQTGDASGEEQQGHDENNSEQGEMPPISTPEYENFKKSFPILQKMEDIDFSGMIPNTSPFTNEAILRFFRLFAHANELSVPQAVAVFNLLSLKGAANRGAPDSLSVTINGEIQGHSTPIEVNKRDLLVSYEKIFGNIFIRRLAEFLATPISLFAEKYRLTGDLATQLSTLVNLENGEQPLSPGEKAWASSFNQLNPDCAAKYNRVAILLNKDYYAKFKKKGAQSSQAKDSDSQKKGKKSTPRKSGPGKTNK